MTNTGPPYPPPPRPGSNAIGLFVIGVSPIGDIAPFNLWETVISQYANSPIIDALVESFDAAMDQTQNFDALYDDIWNVESATGYGLDVWGRIVNVSRVINVPTQDYFGFDGAGQPWGQGPWYSGEPTTENYSLSDTAYRQLILAKALANVSGCSIPEINRVLMTLFPGQGNAYVTDGIGNGNYFGFDGAGQPWGQGPWYDGEAVPTMSMTYTFEFALTPVQLTIVQSSGVLPRPVGVSATVVQI